jgi:hypothetical protein
MYLFWVFRTPPNGLLQKTTAPDGHWSRIS